MDWKIGQAKQRFSEVVQRAKEAPQIIYNRDKPVAAVISARGFQEFKEWNEARREKNLADRFAELHTIFSAEEIAPKFPPLKNRRNKFTDSLDELSVRHYLRP